MYFRAAVQSWGVSAWFGLPVRPARELPSRAIGIPDVIESISFTGGPSVTIKSHHNVGGLPASFVGRHPFPGPGLAIRIPGEITPEKLDILRQADAIDLDEIRSL